MKITRTLPQMLGAEASGETARTPPVLRQTTAHRNGLAVAVTRPETKGFRHDVKITTELKGQKLRSQVMTVINKELRHIPFALLEQMEPFAGLVRDGICVTEDLTAKANRSTVTESSTNQQGRI